MIITLIIIFCIVVVLHAFTDTYKASNKQSYWVFLIPGYGVTCLNLPTDLDKDRVDDFFYLKVRDYLHGAMPATSVHLALLLSCCSCKSRQGAVLPLSANPSLTLLLSFC